MARSSKQFRIDSSRLRTKLRNDTTFNSYFTMLQNISENTFKWDGLPFQVDPVFIEKMLFQYGLVAVFMDKDIGLVALPAMPAGNFNIYGMPVMVRAFSDRNGFSQLLKYSPVLEKTDCILIHNTNRDLNSSIFKSTLAMYTERLTDMKRTEDVNIHAQRTPVTTVVPEGQITTYQNALETYEKYGQTIVGYKGFDVDAVKCIKTDAPFVADKVDELFIKTWNEAIGFLGVSNISITKKERQTNDEVARAMGGALAFRNVRQEPRERAVELINAKYGLETKVTFSEDLFDLELFANNGEFAPEQLKEEETEETVEEKTVEEEKKEAPEDDL